MKKFIFVSFCFFLLAVLAAGFFKEKENNTVEIAQNDKNTDISDDFLLGQNFIVGIPGKALDEKTKSFLLRIKPAGIILYSRNYETRSQFKELIDKLQEFAKESTGQRYFIMIDEEPQGATRLGLFRDVFSDSERWDLIEEDMMEMSVLGINVNLAPVMDYPFNEDSFIKKQKRIWTSNPEDFINFNRSFIILLQENNISATLKHFPGMGVFSEDPHKKILHVFLEEEELKESLEFFRAGINAGADFVMTSHAMYENFDQNISATFSKKIVKDILQTDLGFSGIIITDDLSDMPFITVQETSITEATIESLVAGHNLALFSHNHDKVVEVFDKLLGYFQDNKDLKQVVEQNYNKVVSFKKHKFSVIQ